MDVLMQTFCSKWSDLYNSFNPPKKITFLPSFVLELTDRGTTPVVCGGEPFIEGDYKKFNNNSGYVNSDAARNTPQAFSHFSLVHSNQELVIIDIQGVNDFYTDPQIHTKSGKGFGEGNLGKDGIYQFVKSHQCNPLCTYLKLEPLNSSRRMLLRGTLPVVQLEFDKNTQSAVIKDDGSGNAGDEDDEDDKKRGGSVQHPLQPSAAPTSPARRENSWLAAQPPPNSALEAHGLQAQDAGQAQNPLQPKASDRNHPHTANGAASSAPTPAAAAAHATPAAATPHAVPAAAAPAPAATTQAAAPSTPSQDTPEPLWDLKNFKLFETVRGSQAECIVSDDKLLYSGSSDGSLGIWDPVGLKHIGNFKAGHTKAVKSLLLNKGVLFSAGSDAVIKEWDIENQKAVSEFKDKGEINSIVLQDNLLFSGSNDKTVKVWDLKSKNCIATLSSHTRAVKCLYVLGNYLFSGSNDQQILVWSLQTNSVLTNLQGHEGWIKSLAGNKSTLYSGSHDETIRVWDLNSLQCKHTLKAKDKVEALLATPQALFSASGDFFEIWDSNTYNLASSTNARTSILALARHGPRVFCGSIGNHLKVWSCE
eukprot:Phypoly_transcript_03364.p1 GENE.Phypoly_transcript_03364~~Phypoly_transcript_03364.p1  ORF type:complete len:592 (+),score=116.89 Phypoly_transcript_03364:400-2175(+)